MPSTAGCDRGASTCHPASGSTRRCGATSGPDWCSRFGDGSRAWRYRLGRLRLATYHQLRQKRRAGEIGRKSRGLEHGFQIVAQMALVVRLMEAMGKALEQPVPVRLIAQLQAVEKTHRPPGLSTRATSCVT